MHSLCLLLWTENGCAIHCTLHTHILHAVPNLLPLPLLFVSVVLSVILYIKAVLVVASTQGMYSTLYL